MQFTAIGVAPLPDIETARRNFALHDLDDGDVAKVLFHRRKQQGNGEALGWDQLRIGVASLVRIDTGGAGIETLSSASQPEQRLLDGILRAIEEAPPLVTWGGHASLLPLLQFRCMKHRRSARVYWERQREGATPHIDLQQALLAGAESGAPSLDDLARRLGLPGMLGRREASLWDAWLGGDHETLAAYADYQAINTALLAAAIFHLQGRCSVAELDAMQDALRHTLRQVEPARYRDLLSNWESAS